MGLIERRRAMLLVKVGRQGGRIQEFAMPPGARMQDVFKQASIQLAPGEICTKNGNQTNLFSGDGISNGDIILVMQAQKSLMIRVARLGKPFTEVGANRSDTVRTILQDNGFTPIINEDVWIHYEGIAKGEKIGLDERPAKDCYLVIEPQKKTLEMEVEQFLKDRYGVRGNNNLYLGQLISLIKNYRY